MKNRIKGKPCKKCGGTQYYKEPVVQCVTCKREIMKKYQDKQATTDRCYLKYLEQMEELKSCELSKLVDKTQKRFGWKWIPKQAGKPISNIYLNGLR